MVRIILLKTLSIKLIETNLDKGEKKYNMLIFYDDLPPHDDMIMLFLTTQC